MFERSYLHLNAFDGPTFVFLPYFSRELRGWVAIMPETGQNNCASLNLPGSVNSFPDLEVKTMSSDKDPNNAARGSLRLAPAFAEVEVEKAKLPRQFVHFTFYRARPEWRLL